MCEIQPQPVDDDVSDDASTVTIPCTPEPQLCSLVDLFAGGQTLSECDDDDDATIPATPPPSVGSVSTPPPPPSKRRRRLRRVEVDDDEDDDEDDEKEEEVQLAQDRTQQQLDEWKDEVLESADDAVNWMDDATACFADDPCLPNEIVLQVDDLVDDSKSYIRDHSTNLCGVSVSGMRNTSVFLFQKKKEKNAKTVGPMRACIDYAVALNLPIVCQFQRLQRHGFRIIVRYYYVAFSNSTQLYDFIESRPSMNFMNRTCMFEVIRDTHPCRAYFDIDVKINYTPTDAARTSLVTDMRSAIKMLCSMYSVPSSVSECLVIVHRCCRPPNAVYYKLSYHLILPFIYFDNNYDGSLLEWAKTLNELLVPSFSEIAKMDVSSVVDPRVYNRNQLMSMIGTIKSYRSVEETEAATPLALAPSSSYFCSSPLEQLQSSLISLAMYPPESLVHLFNASSPSEEFDFSSTQSVSMESRRLLPVSATLPTQITYPEMLLLERWFRGLYLDRRLGAAATYLPDPELSIAKWEVRGTTVFVTPSNDPFCIVRRGVHTRQKTTYQADLLTSRVKQNCFSCGSDTPSLFASTLGENYSVVNAMIMGDEYLLVKMMNEELNDPRIVVVEEINTGRSTLVHIFNRLRPGNSFYNECVVPARHNMWITGSPDYLRVNLMQPWLEVKFMRALKKAKDDGDEKAEELLLKAKRKIFTEARLSSITKQLTRTMITRCLDEPFEQTLNRNSEQPYLVPTSNHMAVETSNMQERRIEPGDYYSHTMNFSLLGLSRSAEEEIECFDQFVLTCMGGSRKKADYMQKISGYSMTLDKVDRRVYMHIGCGSNGKTTYDECIAAAMGKYHKTVRPSLVTRKTGSHSASARPDLMSLEYARWASCNETMHDHVMDDSIIKLFADGGTHSARQLYREERDLVLYIKLHIFSNFMLRLSTHDQALIDRIVVICWPVRFVNDPEPGNPLSVKKNPALVNRLKSNVDAIGTWLCRGAHAAYKDIQQNRCIVLPDEVVEETKREIDKVNNMRAFFQTKLRFHDCVTNRSITILPSERDAWLWEKQAMFEYYKRWAVSSGAVDKYDLQLFNGCVQKYIALHKYNVQEVEEDGLYQWLGVQPIDMDDSNFVVKKRRIDDHFQPWVNND